MVKILYIGHKLFRYKNTKSVFETLSNITTNVGGMKYLLTNDDASLIEKNNHIELAISIKNLIKNKEFVSSLRKSNRKKSEQFSWNKIKEELKRLLLE